jgi:hypothetical protein
VVRILSHDRVGRISADASGACEVSPIEGELTPPDDSLRSELEAAFGGSNEESAQDSPIEASGDEPAPETIEDAPAETDGRARGPDGKFAKTETKAAPEKVAAAQELPSTDAAKASTEAAQTATNVPPAGWTAAEKAEWSKLSPVAQAAVSRREAEIANGGRQWSEEKRRYEAVLSPVAEAARRNGMNTEQGLQALLNAQSFLERDPTAAIKWLAQSHGVNLATLAGQSDEVSSATQSPDIEAIVRQAVQRSVAPIVAPIQQRWQQEEQRQTEMTTQMVVDFAAAKDHELFGSVEQDIMDLIPPLKERNPNWSPQQILQEAYDRAVFANPATRQTLLATREQAAEEKRRTEAAQRATKARGAAVSVTGSPQGSAGQEPAASLRDEIMRAMTG